MEEAVRTFEVTLERAGKVTSRWETKALSLQLVVLQLGEALAGVIRTEQCDAIKIFPREWK